MDNPLSNPQPNPGSPAADPARGGNGGAIPPRPTQSASEAAAQQPRPAYAAPGAVPPRPEQSAPQHAQGQTQATQTLPPYGWGHGHDAGHGANGGDGAAYGPQPKPDSSGQPRKRVGAIAGLLVAAALVGGAAGLGGAYAGSTIWNDGSGTTASPSDPSSITVNNPGSVNEATAVAAEVTPGTVTITVSSGQESGNGTGVVLSDDGYVLTNTHVVTLGGAASDGTIRVTGSDGKIYDAEVVGTDPTYDLAVIKLKDASGLTPIEFADSSKLNVGDTAVAIGAPLGLPNTVTTGIVSALNRSIQIQSSEAPDSADSDDSEGDGGEQGESPWFFDVPGQEQQEQSQAQESISLGVIQTDASINPGNSGGPLVNSEGKLIGINVAIASAGGDSSSESGSVGIGFAIPANVAERVANELIDNGEATHGLLGASVTNASQLEEATVEGAAIAEVSGGGAAEEAGLKKGDVVTEFNGVPIGSSTDLTAQVRAVAGGSDATLTYVRDGREETAEVTLGTL